MADVDEPKSDNPDDPWTPHKTKGELTFLPEPPSELGLPG
mgnify:CR=1 FL=1